MMAAEGVRCQASTRVHTVNADNTSTALCRNLKPAEFCWLLDGSGWVTEAHTFYMISRTGEYILLQVAYSNLSWPAHPTCQMSALYSDAGSCAGKTDSLDGSKPRFLTRMEEANPNIRHRIWTGSTKGNKMKVSAGKTSLQVKQMTISPTDDGAYEIVFDEEDLKFRLRFAPLADAFMIGDGSVHFGKDGSDGMVSLKFIPAGKVDGIVTVDGTETGFDGFGLCVRQFQNVKPYLSASRWHLSYFQATDSDMSLMLLQMQTPSTYDSVVYTIGSLFADGALLGVSLGNQVTVVSKTRDGDSQYAIPSELRFDWRGTTFDGRPFEAACTVAHETLCIKVCVLDSLPYVVRKVIGTFLTRPYIYQWVERVAVDLGIGGEKRVHTGWMLHEITLLND